MVDPTEQAALLAERFGRIFGEDDSAGDRGTAIVRRTANSIAAMIRRDSDTHPKGGDAARLNGGNTDAA